MKNFFFINFILIHQFILINAQESIFSKDFNSDITLIILVFFISIITTIGGVGGGGILIPTYVLLGKFELKHAIPLSVFTILGDTFIRSILLFNKNLSNS